MTAILVLCTCPDEASGESIASALVSAGIAACVNRVPGIISSYRWRGEVRNDREHLLIIKTTRERFAALRERVLSMHPYELPEIIAVDVVDGLDRYLAWIVAQTRGADGN
jgi:periplasmic divalent cation tolerance protein